MHTAGETQIDRLDRLLGAEGAARDEAWMRAVCRFLPDTPLKRVAPRLITTEMGFRVISLVMPSVSYEVGASVTIREILDEAIDAEAGISIWKAPPQDEPPAVVLSFGRLVSLRRWNSLDGNPSALWEAAEAEVRGLRGLEGDQKPTRWVSTRPDRSHIPPESAAALRTYLSRVLVGREISASMVFDSREMPPRRIVLDVRESMTEETVQTKAAMGGMFFFPPGWPVDLDLENVVPNEAFVPLFALETPGD